MACLVTNFQGLTMNLISKTPGQAINGMHTTTTQLTLKETSATSQHESQLWTQLANKKFSRFTDSTQKISSARMRQVFLALTALVPMLSHGFLLNKPNSHIISKAVTFYSCINHCKSSCMQRTYCQCTVSRSKKSTVRLLTQVFSQQRLLTVKRAGFLQVETLTMTL